MRASDVVLCGSYVFCASFAEKQLAQVHEAMGHEGVGAHRFIEAQSPLVEIDCGVEIAHGFFAMSLIAIHGAVRRWCIDRNWGATHPSRNLC